MESQVIKNPEGRPTKYSQELLAKSYKYLKDYEEIGQVLPSVEGLADYLDITRSTLYKWVSEEDKTEFSDIVELLLNKKAVLLQNKGLKNEFNSAIVKLLLSKHGYAEKTETDITTKGESIAGLSDVEKTELLKLLQPDEPESVEESNRGDERTEEVSL